MAKATAKKKPKQNSEEAPPATNKAVNEVTVTASDNSPPPIPTQRKTKTKSKTKAAPMATATARKPKAKTNKSEQIRAALKADPAKSAAEIARSVGVTPALVYNVKANMAKKAGKPKGKPGRKPTGASQNGVAVSTDSALDSALTFVTSVGGLLRAEQLLDKLKTIKERL